MYKQIHTDTTIHKFYICICEITHYPLKSLFSPLRRSTAFLLLFIRPRVPLRRLPVSSSVTLLHPVSILSAPARSSGSAGASAATADQSISIMSGHFTCFQRVYCKSFTSQRTGKLPRFSAAAGSEFLTLSFYFISLCCVLSLHFAPKNLGVRQLSQLFFFFIFVVFCFFLLDPTKSCNLKSLF